MVVAGRLHVRVQLWVLEANGAVRKPVKRRSSHLRDRLWVRLSPWLLILQVRQVPSGVGHRSADRPIGRSPTSPARYRDLQLRVGQCSSEPHKL